MAAGAASNQYCTAITVIGEAAAPNSACTTIALVKLPSKRCTSAAMLNPISPSIVNRRNPYC